MIYTLQLPLPRQHKMLSPRNLQAIGDLVDETINQALKLAKGSSGFYLQSLIEEDLLEGTNFRKELNDEIAYKLSKSDLGRDSLEFYGPLLVKKVGSMIMADQHNPETFEAALNARELAHIYHDTHRDTKFYVEHGALPHELIVPAWDHLATFEPKPLNNPATPLQLMALISSSSRLLGISPSDSTTAPLSPRLSAEPISRETHTHSGKSGDGPKTVITAEGFLRLTYRVDSDGKVLSDWVTMNDDVLRETTNVWCASKCTPSISCASMQILFLSLYCLFSTKFAIQPGSLRKNQLIDAAALQQLKFVERFFFTVFNDRYYSKSKSYNTASTYTAVSIQAAVNEYICFQELLCSVGRGNPVFASLFGDIQ
ncbi:hypothetical protein D6D05_08571 [Aureobasidium pullulans]|nr:hypothetical protein D6D05_08571 [Aureobasidium pullulans]